MKFNADQPKPLLKRVLERHLPHDVLDVETRAELDLVSAIG